MPREVIPGAAALILDTLLIRRGFVDLVRRSATCGIRATGLTSLELAASRFGSGIRLIVVLGSRARHEAQHGTEEKGESKDSHS